MQFMPSILGPPSTSALVGMTGNHKFVIISIYKSIVKMNYSKNRGYINVVLLVVIIIVFFAFVGWISYNTGINIGEGRSDLSAKPKIILNGIDVPLVAISLAENAELQKLTGLTKLDIEVGLVEIDILFPEAVVLPQNSVLAAWLVDAGNLGGLGQTAVSDADQQYGTPYANVDFSKSVDDVPYAFSLGKLAWDDIRESYYMFFEAKDNLSPYDAVMITIESDSNGINYDPRPGTPIMIGEIIK